MEEKDFNDRIAQSYFDQVKKKLGVHGEGYKVIEFMDMSCIVTDKFTDQLNNHIGAYLNSRKKQLTVDEKAALYEKLSVENMQLCVNAISVIMKMGRITSLLLDQSDALLKKYMQYVEEHKEQSEVFSSFLLNQYIGVQKEEK